MAWYPKVLGGLGVISLLACGSGMPEPKSGDDASKPPPIPQKFKNRCEDAQQHLRPLVVEWTAPDRAALEAQARQGQLVVHYEGCKLEVLRRCRAPEQFTYAYTAITPKDEVVTIENADQLYAAIPLGAVELEGKLASSGQLRAEMRIVGEYGVAGEPPALDQLQGECDGATHVVAALTVGAFRFEAGAKHAAGASAKVMGAGAGAETSRSEGTLSQDGTPSACESSKRGDGAPPEGCGALLRIELAPVLAAGEGTPTCKPWERLVGKSCEPIPKPVELAAEDKSFQDDKRGFGWGTRCHAHLKAGALPYARAACEKGLEAGPDNDTKGAILYNYALVELAAGDTLAACQKLSQSLAVRPNASAQKKVAELNCLEVTRSAGE